MTAAKRHDAEAKIKIAKMTKKIREDERQAEAAREYARSLKQNTKENVGIMSVKKENDESLDIKIHSYKLYSGQRFAAASRMIDMYDQNKFKKLYGNKLKDKINAFPSNASTNPSDNPTAKQFFTNDLSYLPADQDSCLPISTSYP